MHPFQFAGALPDLHSVPNRHSNPIVQRVHRKRQRLPPSLLIENASGLIFRLPDNYLAEAFPIKASDNSGAGKPDQKTWVGWPSRVLLPARRIRASILIIVTRSLRKREFHEFLRSNAPTHFSTGFGTLPGIGLEANVVESFGRPGALHKKD